MSENKESWPELKGQVNRPRTVYKTLILTRHYFSRFSQNIIPSVFTKSFTLSMVNAYVSCVSNYKIRQDPSSCQLFLQKYLKCVVPEIAICYLHYTCYMYKKVNTLLHAS